MSAESFLRRLRLIEGRERLVKVKSWWPSLSLDRRYLGVEWPVMLVQRGGSRWTASPLWDLARLQHLWREGLEGAAPRSATGWR